MYSRIATCALAVTCAGLALSTFSLSEPTEPPAIPQPPGRRSQHTQTIPPALQEELQQVESAKSSSSHETKALPTRSSGEPVAPSQPTPTPRALRANEQKDPRITPTVTAVEKTADSIVTLKVVKPTSRTDVIGTGVIIDERGYLITNHHVVRNSVRVKAYLRDTTYVRASVYKTFPKHDLAVVRLHTREPLKALTLGPGSDLRRGEPVLAIGAPYGFEQTVTRGIISGMDRRVKMPTGIVLTNLIQTDAAINPGNSGGALINLRGELIGINVAVHKTAQNIAFAINVDTVQQVLSEQLSARKQSGVRHGLKCAVEVSPRGEQRSQVIVMNVGDDSPAFKAGVRAGDVLVQVDERPVRNRFDVERRLWEVRKEIVSVKVLRRGLELSLRMNLDVRTAHHR